MDMKLIQLDGSITQYKKDFSKNTNKKEIDLKEIDTNMKKQNINNFMKSIQYISNNIYPNIDKFRILYINNNKLHTKIITKKNSYSILYEELSNSFDSNRNNNPKIIKLDIKKNNKFYNLIPNEVIIMNKNDKTQYKIKELDSYIMNITETEYYEFNTKFISDITIISMIRLSNFNAHQINKYYELNISKIIEYKAKKKILKKKFIQKKQIIKKNKQKIINKLQNRIIIIIKIKIK